MQSYIDFEIQEGERERARELYERLLERTTHVKVWLSYAAFEAEELPVDEEDEEVLERLNERKASGAETSASREAKARRSEALLLCWKLIKVQYRLQLQW